MAYIQRTADPAASPFVGEIEEQQLTASAGGTWQVRAYSDYKDLETLWRRLETEGHSTIFQTYDWASCWYDTAIASGEAEPLIVIVCKEEAEPVWILPLCLYRDKGRRIISFADLGVSDYAGPVMAPGVPQDKATVQTMIATLFDTLPPCDIINFQKLVDKVDGVPNPLLYLRGLEKFPASRHGIRLSEPWTTLAQKIMQKRLRLTIRRKKKKIGMMENVFYKKNDTPGALTEDMDCLLNVRRERFKSIGRSDLPQIWDNFYHNLAGKRPSSFHPSITTMVISGEPVAFCFGIQRGKCFHALLATFKMGKWEAFRPGMILFDKLLADFAEESKGEGYFDFTVGDEVYKDRLGCESRPLYEWMAPRSASGLAAFLAWRAKVFLRRHPRLIAVVKKVLNKKAGED